MSRRYLDGFKTIITHFGTETVLFDLLAALRAFLRGLNQKVIP